MDKFININGASDKILDSLKLGDNEHKERACHSSNETGSDDGLINIDTERKKRKKGEKIKMTTPLVEMDGDEMTRVIWKMIKEKLILPYVDLKTEYYDLGLENRDKTDDKVTEESAYATKKYGVAVKCATITPNADRVKEYGLKKMWKSPNGTIRSILDGTVFRAPIAVRGIKPVVSNWEEPITVARHAYGDVYSNTELTVPEGAKAELCITLPNGTETRSLIHNFEGDGIVQGMHNTDESISSFAHSCFQYALHTKQDLWFATKDTVSKKYDARFRKIFEDIYEKRYSVLFRDAGISFFYTLIDDAVARVMRSKGGFIWACKNYDGDVMSDMIASANGSLAMMTSVLVSPDDVYEFEAAHGTVQKHYYKYLKNEPTSTNSMATIFAWTGALNRRGQLDELYELCEFAGMLESAALGAVCEGVMTGDLYNLSDVEGKKKVTTEEFIDEIARRLEEYMEWE